MSDQASLILPLAVEALVVNDHNRVDKTFWRAQMEYNALQNFTSGQANISDTNFTTSNMVGHNQNIPASMYYNGVYLKWRIPKALRHGRQHSADGTMKYPPVPNRWLVVRLSGPLDSRAATAWVVESDYIWQSNPTPNNASEEAALYVGPASPTDNTPVGIYIGRNVPLGSWTEPNTKLHPPLTAVAPGNPAFAFYQPQNNNVFSFIDVQGNSPQDKLSYQVVGWFSDPNDDPLLGVTASTFKMTLDKLGWALAPGTDPTLTTQRILMVGYVSGVEWQTEESPIGGTPGGETPVSIAVGNTSVEALTALVATQASDQRTAIDAELLEAFQLDLLDVLDEPDGAAVLEEKLLASFFQRFSGGYTWTIVNAPGGTDSVSDAELQKEEAWLAQLNERQTTLDNELRKLARLQAQLYVMWWKYEAYNANAPYDPPPPLIPGFEDATKLQDQLDPTHANSIAQQTAAQLDKVQALIAQEPQVPRGNTPEKLKGAITAYSDSQNLPKSRVLKRSAAPPFYLPNNPVVLIAGAGASGIVDDSDTALCRFPSQLVTGFKYHRGQSDERTIDATTRGLTIPQPDLSNVNGVFWVHSLASQLGHEFFFVDPANATMVSSVIPNSKPDEVGKEMSNSANYVFADSEAAWLFPENAVQAWTQNPWHPLLLLWEVDYYPIEYGTTEKPNWTFQNGRYEWNGSPNSVAEQELSPSGLIQLSPTASFNMKARINAFLRNNPDLNPRELAEFKALLSFVQEDDEWDLLSQSLDGFNEQLRLLSSGVFVGPKTADSTLSPHLPALIGDVEGYPPNLPQMPSVPPPPYTSLFQPLRSGQFVLTSLQVVDEWGQSLWPIDDQSQRFEFVYLPPDLSPVRISNPVPFQVKPVGKIAAGDPARGSAGTQAVGPEIRTLTPPSVVAGGQDFILTVSGVGFDPKSLVAWNGLPLKTTFNSATQLTATVPAFLIASPGTFMVTEVLEQKVVPTDSASYIQLPPALLQPARLDFDLISAAREAVKFSLSGQTADPICGWVLPNHLDRSLMAYDAQGSALGEMAVGFNPSSQPEVCWNPAPGSRYTTLTQIADAIRHFGPFLLALKLQGPAAFTAFLHAIDETLWTTAPMGAVFDQSLTVLMGRPLAMVRAQLQFELNGAPYLDPSWLYTFKPADPAVTGYEFAIELGNVSRLEDGLIGYFVEDNYATFNVVGQAGVPAKKYLRPIGLDNNYIYLPFDGKTVTHVSMLVDPRAAVHATTAILPTVVLSLPPQLVSDALARMDVTFRVNGILTDQTHSSAGTTILLPVPKEKTGAWSWLENDAVGDWTPYATGPNDTTARLSNVPPVLRRGLIQLRSALGGRNRQSS